jgi:hypothetical protein
MDMLKKALASAAVVLAATTMMSAQQKMQASPAGKAQAQVGFTGATRSDTFKSGKWIEITYGRPVLAGRTNIFGSGADYGKNVVTDGATIWRAGANKSTRLRTETPIVIGGKTIPAGEYSVFIDVKPSAWTFVLSNWAAAENYPSPSKDQLWGSFDYTPAKDVVRAPMKLAKNTMSIDQLTWTFANVTANGGDLVIMWDKEIASVPFTVAK